MNYLPILRLGFSHLTIADVSLTTKNIITMMTGNTNFPTLQDGVAELQVCYDTFLNAIVSPEVQSQVTRDALRIARRKLQAQLKALGNSVMGVAGDDIEMLLTSGYILREKSTPRPVPGVPKGLEVYETNTQGVIMVSCKKIEDATNYIARLSTDKVDWKWTDFSNGIKVMLTGVPVNQLVYVQMQTRNAAGSSDWSNTVEAYFLDKNTPTVKKMNV